MTYQLLKLNIKGVNEIIMHNGQMVDPRNKFSKALRAVSSKRKKTDADLDQMALIEFAGGIYVRDNQIAIPDFVIEAAIINGAKKSKSGTQAKTAIFVKDWAEMDYDGKPESVTTETIEAMFESGEFHLSMAVKVGQSRIIRTRPKFKNWSATIELEYDDEFVNRKEVIQFVTDAGRQVGLCDWRPKYGRFTVEEAA